MPEREPHFFSATMESKSTVPSPAVLPMKFLWNVLIISLCISPCHANIYNPIGQPASGVSRRTDTSDVCSVLPSASRTKIAVGSTFTTKGSLPSGTRTSTGGTMMMARPLLAAFKRTNGGACAANLQSLRTDTSCAKYSTSAIDGIPRGGAQKSIQVTEGGNALVAIILNIAGKISPTLAGILRTIFKIIEKITGLDLVPKKVEKKKKQKSKGTKQSRASIAAADASFEDESDEEEEGVEAKRSAKTASKPKPAAAKKKSGGGGGGAKASASAKKHLTANLKTSSPNYRIQRELKSFLSSPPPNLKVSVGKNIRVWIVTFNMPDDTIYAGEKYRLRIQFPADYPTQPPSVFFLQPTPRHEHVYTNGDICLSLLGKDWRPTMTAQSLAVSIMSILSGARKKSLPMDNARQAMNKPGGKQDDWIYHDDNC